MKVVIEMSKELFEQIKNVDIEECETQTEKGLTNIIKCGIPLFEVGQKSKISDNATNGDVIMAMFPSCEQKEHINNGYFEMYFDKDMKNASYMRVNKDWWNAPYKAESEDKE